MLRIVVAATGRQKDAIDEALAPGRSLLIDQFMNLGLS